MFAAARVPASRTSTAYVCYACRSQRIANPQQWRTLSTESHSTSAPQEISPLPPAPNTTYPSSDLGNESRENLNPGSKQRRARQAQKLRILGATSKDAAVTEEVEDFGESEPDPKINNVNGKALKNAETKRLNRSNKSETRELNRSLRERKRAFKERKVPAPLYTTVNDGAGVRSWKAEIAFAGEKFEVEALNKKAVAAKIQDKVMEYIRTMPPLTGSAATEGTRSSEPLDSGQSSRRAAMLRHLSTMATLTRNRRIKRVKVLQVRQIAVTPHRSTRELDITRHQLARKSDSAVGISLKEALTGGRRSAVGRYLSQDEGSVKRIRKPRADFALPNNIRGQFKPTEKVETLNASSLEIVPLHIPQSPVPPLSYGLDRVLFNPGVYRLRDPRSRVYNFDPYLEKVVPADEFDFAALKGYKVASTDPTLSNIAAENGLKYFTSTSSLTSVLMAFHFLISQWRPIDISMLSKTFEGPDKTNFTTFTKAPTSIILKPKNGGYAIDKDDDGFGNTVLSLVGRSLEKLLTVPKKEFEKYRRSKVTGKSSVESQDTEEAFHYTGIGNLLVRSQLDGHDPRLPGTGIFDIKTRAVLPVRMDGKGKMEVASSYEIRNDHGQFESFEREYHDMLRAPMLKYSMQARLGRMDGIFVAYHNISRLFGFQYVSLPEIDRAIHGSSDTFRGDQELRASINILQDVLDRASAKFPDQPLRMMFETRPGDVPFMNVFVEPVTTEYLEERAVEKQRQLDEFENAVIFPNGVTSENASGAVKDQPWTEINEQVQKEIQSDDGVKAESSDSVAELLQAQFDARQPPQAEPKSPLQHLKKLLLGQAKEQASDIDDKAKIAQAQTAAVNIIRETSKFREADITDSKRPSRREELTKITAATKALDKYVEMLHGSVAATPETIDQIARLREVTKRQLEEGSSLKSSHYPNSQSILALALTVRNKINGQYIQGPPDVEREDDWQIEYSIQEMEDNEKAWERYDACKARKDNASAFGKDDPDSDERWYGGRYMQELAEWSRKGGEWRARQDEIDAAVGSRTVFEPIDKSEISDPVGSDEVVKDVDDYMTWLYEGKGGDGKKE